LRRLGTLNSPQWRGSIVACRMACALLPPASSLK
jgi:hypothetical protein